MAKGGSGLLGLLTWPTLGHGAARMCLAWKCAPGEARGKGKVVVGSSGWLLEYGWLWTHVPSAMAHAPASRVTARGGGQVGSLGIIHG